MPSALPLFTADQLRNLAAFSSATGCKACRALKYPGWEALSAAADTSMLAKVGTLRDPGVEDPTLEERRPAGMDTWSPKAPIDPAWFPYNRCDVWQCVQCCRAFLRYTEYGGYYIEERIRCVAAERIVGEADES